MCVALAVGECVYIDDVALAAGQGGRVTALKHAGQLVAAVVGNGRQSRSHSQIRACDGAAAVSSCDGEVLTLDGVGVNPRMIATCTVIKIVCISLSAFAIGVSAANGRLAQVERLATVIYHGRESWRSGQIYASHGAGAVVRQDNQCSRRHRRRLIIAAHVFVVGIHNRECLLEGTVGVSAGIGAAGWSVVHCQHITCGKASHGVSVGGNLCARACHIGNCVTILHSAGVVEGATLHGHGQRCCCYGQRSQVFTNGVVARCCCSPSDVVSVCTVAHIGLTTCSSYCGGFTVHKTSNGGCIVGECRTVVYLGITGGGYG